MLCTCLISLYTQSLQTNQVVQAGAAACLRAMRAGPQPAERPDDVQSAPPGSSPGSSLSPFGDHALAASSLPSGASEPDLSEAERQSHVSAARSQSTTSALRRMEYASKSRKAMARLAEHSGGRDSVDMKRTRSVRLGLARVPPPATQLQTGLGLPMVRFL